MSNELQEDVVPGPGVKTLAVRLNHEMHTQLSVIAQLRGNNIANEIRQAVAAHIEALKADPIVVGRADRARQDIEAEAAERRKTLATLFGEGTPSAKGSGSRTRRAPRSSPNPPELRHPPRADGARGEPWQGATVRDASVSHRSPCQSYLLDP